MNTQNVEMLFVVVTAVATAMVMLSAIFHPSMGMGSWIGRTVYGALMAIILGFICMKVGGALGIPILTWVGAIAGGILGFFMLINKFIVWLWKKFWKITTWWMKLIVGAVIVLAIVAIIFM